MHPSFQPEPAHQSKLEFQPCEIVCLEHEGVRLYAEVVQMADGKQVCWVRPLAMLEETVDWLAKSWTDAPKVYNLQQSSDLLLPSGMFRNALDTEVIPLIHQWSELTDSQWDGADQSQARLREFIKRVCLAHPELF